MTIEDMRDELILFKRIDNANKEYKPKWKVHGPDGYHRHNYKIRENSSKKRQNKCHN